MKYITILLALLLTLPACKTTEENYRRAYEKTKEREAERTPFEETIYSDIRNQAQNHTLAVGQSGDSVNVRLERVTVADGQTLPGGPMRQYNVVAGQFKQRFHANSLARRMAEKGYPDAFVIQNAEPLYYVVVLSTGTLEEAAEEFKKLQSDSPVTLLEGFPIILSPLR